MQPPVSLLAALPRTATLTMASGDVVELTMMPEQAPVTVANFVTLARAGYYDGLTFHRVVPNFVVQGGSPGANEYMGDARYWRDEIGLASNLRGTVGLSTRGRDTGDGQFYVNLVDLPRLDHDYTVFARVSTGMDAIDRMLEGAVIQRVTVR
jgi:cyclophilin family peptidyl-prolyl cis-trans isomerase